MDRIDELNNLWVIDVEQFANFHSLCGINIYTGKEVEFVIHPARDDREAYLNWLDSEPVWITFNGISYDYPLVHRILRYRDYYLNNTVHQVVHWLFETSKKIISEKFSDIRPEECYIKQYDLFRIHHYNNKARVTSLKSLEFFLRWKNVQDLPFPFDHYVTKDEIDEIIKYNKNDIYATKAFWEYTVKTGAIDLRHDLSSKYNMDLYNANDVKIGTELFAHFLAEHEGKTTADIKSYQTKRYKIPLKDCILDYVSFTSPEFSALLSFLKSKTVIDTKGVFKNISLKKYPYLKKYGETKEIKEGKLKALCINYKGVPYYFGTGGLHSCNESGVYRSDHEYDIIAADVKSYYPNLCIVNGFKPEHLGDSFTDIYKWMYEERLKIPKSNPMNKALKLALNGSFGKLNDANDWLFDRKALLQVTLNGQLLLAMLCEKVLTTCPKSTLIQANTDGIFVRVHKSEKDAFMHVCKDWEKLTGLVLEYDHFTFLAQRDVNNYCGQEVSGKMKYKGAFEIDRQPHKNHSQRIVPIAVARYFVSGIPVSDTIKNHLQATEYTDIGVKAYGTFDFCKKVRSKFSEKKGGRASFKLLSLRGNDIVEEELQKVNRYVMVKNGGRLIKYYPDGSESRVEAGSATSIILNRFKDLTEDDIDFNYYINEANKIIKKVEGVKKASQLSMF